MFSLRRLLGYAEHQAFSQTLLRTSLCKSDIGIPCHLSVTQYSQSPVHWQSPVHSNSSCLGHELLTLTSSSWVCSYLSMGLFSCCTGDRKQEKNEVENRQARIVEIYRQTETVSEMPTRPPPPSYNEVVCDNLSGATMIIDEKPAQTQAQPLAHTYPRTSISRPSSPRTSICSIPSTRLTDLTSAHTGGTIVPSHTQQGDSARSSLVFDSAPPSYYDGRSTRERSTSSNSQRQLGERHPVMAEDWLEHLRRAAENEHRRV